MSVHTCRICRQPRSSVALQDKCECKGHARSISYLDAFNECTHLMAKICDELPQCLCSECSIELLRCYDFVQLAKQSDEELRNLYVAGIKEDGRALDEVAAETSSFATGEKTLKDPLEDSDHEEEMAKETSLQWTAAEVDSSNHSDYDEEDNKPLKHLLLVKSEIFERSQEINQVESELKEIDTTKLENKNPDNEETEYCYTEATNVSTEEQIFPQGSLKCLICGKAYFTPIGLKTHLEVHEPKINSPTIKRKRARSSNKKQPNERTSQNKADVANYMQMEQPLENEVEAVESGQRKGRSRKPKLPKPKKMFPCQVCGKHMISASKLRYHMVMHTGEKDYLCTMCPKAYSTIYALKHHIKTHTGDRPYECRFCGDRFLRPTTLKSHIRRHTGERPYGCDICGKRFIQHSSMTTHIKLNHMAKTIPCPHCEKKYARQTDLNTHLLSHTGDKPFSCKLCPSRFIRQANLNKHMNQHHSGDSSRETKQSKSTKASKTIQMKAAADNIDDALNIESPCSPSVAISAKDVNLPELYVPEDFDDHIAAEEEQIRQLSDCLQAEACRIPIPMPIIKDTLVDSAAVGVGPNDLFATTIEDDLQRWNWPSDS